MKHIASIALLLSVASCGFSVDFTGTTCGADGLCPEGLVCSTATNTCVETADEPGDGMPGETCGAGNECSTGICVDGVCCNALCDGQCEACDLAGAEGTCSPVTGDPRGGREACAGAGSVCGGACDGETRAACTYPAVECSTGGCEGDVFSEPATCVEGVCPAAEQLDCAATSDTKYCTDAGCLGVTQIVAGYDFTCTLMSDTSVFCWGANGVGQLAQGLDDTDMPDTESRSVPSRVPDLVNVTYLSAATAFGGHACALQVDKTAVCWGSNFSGQLGIGSDDRDPHPTPEPLKQNATTVQGDINDIATGQGFTCFVDAAGTARCVGANTFGQLGDGTSGDSADRLFPVQAGATGEFGAIWSGYDHSCASVGRMSPTTVKCWGANGNLGVGVATGDVIATPVRAANFSTLDATKAQPIGTGGLGVSCGIANNSVLNCWGRNTRGQLGRNTSGTATNSAIAAPVCTVEGRTDCTAVGEGLNLTTSFAIGEFTACAVAGGDVYCWGDNNRGQLGDGTFEDHFFAKAIDLPEKAEQVALGGFHACALLADRTVRCWGWNGDGQLGDGEPGPNVPSPVEPVFSPAPASAGAL